MIKSHENHALTFADTRGGIAYRIGGDGRAVLFLHALGTSRELWHHLPGPDDRWQLIAPDMRGHGQSPPPQDNDYSFESLACDVRDVLNHHAVSQASIVGISVGGEIAQTFAALFPERVARLLLVSTACITSPARAVLWSQRIAEAESQGMAAVAETAVKRWFTASFQAAQPQQVQRWKHVVSGTSLAGYVGVARRIQTMDLTVHLKKITCRTHILVGGLDTATGADAAADIARHIRGASIKTIAGAGHLWNLEMPQLFGNEINAWLGDE